MKLKQITGVLIAGASMAMAGLTWGEPAAMAWIVAFCGWVPHAMPDDEVEHGNS